MLNIPTGTYCLKLDCPKCSQHLLYTLPQRQRKLTVLARSTEDFYAVKKDFFKCSNCKSKYDFEIHHSNSHKYFEFKNENDEELIIEFVRDPYEYYDEHLAAIQANDNFFETFQTEILNLKLLNDIDTNNASLNSILKKQIYTAAVVSMETFLSDSFINLTLKNEERIKRFVKTHPDFKDRKFDLKDIFEQFDRIKDTAKTVMIETIYHNLPKVKLMYESVFDITFPTMSEAIKCVNTRHDLVHRNGKTKEGTRIILNKRMVEIVISIIENFIGSLQISLDEKLNPPKPPIGKHPIDDDDLPF